MTMTSPLSSRRAELGSPDRFELGPIAEIVEGEGIELVVMSDRRVAQRSPQRTDTGRGQPIPDPVAVASTANQPSLGKGTKMKRGIGDTLVNLGSELLDMTLALLEHVDQLNTTSRRQRLGHLGEGVEERRLRLMICHSHPETSLPHKLFK